MTDGQEAKEAVAALERLVHRHKVVTPEQARTAARLVTGDPTFELPDPSAPPTPAAPAAAPAPDAAPDPATPSGSEKL